MSKFLKSPQKKPLLERGGVARRAGVVSIPVSLMDTTPAASAFGLASTPPRSRRGFFCVLTHCLAIIVAVWWAFPASAQVSCHATESSVRIALPGHPYAAVAAADGCSIFVSLQNPGSIALVAFEAGKFAVKNSAPLTIQPAGLALTHDGKILVAPGVDGVAFIDTNRLLSGGADAVLGTLDDGGKGPIQADISADDRFLFVSNERSNTITTIDLVKSLANGFKPDSIVGQIPTGTQPVGLTLSPDQKFLYGVVEIAKDAAGGPTCAEAGRGGQTTSIPEGLLTVIDAAKAKTAPATAVIAELPAGCRPVRVVVSKDGARVYVAARGSNEIVAFDTALARTKARTARLGSIKLPSSAIGLALTADGFTLIASNASTLTFIDAMKLAIKGTAPTSGAGRELFIGHDNKTLLLTNNAASVLEIFDLTKLPR
jgi:DNA-binding beta-propeller fold protein YncE